MNPADAPKAAKVPEVDSSFNRLAENLGNLSETIDRLKHKLHSVLGPERPQQTTDGGLTPTPPPTRISEKLSALSEGVRRELKNVHDIIDRLEI